MCRFATLVNVRYGGLLYILFHHLGIKLSTLSLFFSDPLPPPSSTLKKVPVSVPFFVSMFSHHLAPTYALFSFLFVHYFAKDTGLQFIHLPTKDMISFFFMAAQYSIVYPYHIFFIQSVTDGHLG